MKEIYLGVGTPYQAPINVLFAIAKTSGVDEQYVPMCMSGWQRGAIYDIEIGEPIYQFPNGFAAVWLSLTERKVYEIDIDFSNVMIDDVLGSIKKGFKNRRGEEVTYTHFKLSFFPGGVVKIHLLANSKIKSLDYTFEGNVTSEYDNAFLDGFGLDSKIRSIDDYCNIYYLSNDEDDKNEMDLKNDSLQENVDYVNKIALPNKLWERYYRRYDYTINFEFEDSNSRLYFWAAKFSNSESFSYQSGVNDEVFICQPAALCTINLWWQNDQYRYTSYFYFREEEMLALLEDNFNNGVEEKAKFLLKIGKYNNSFELSFYIGMNSYPLQHTEIRVFRDPISDLTGESELVYKNYENNHQNIFRGL